MRLSRLIDGVQGEIIYDGIDWERKIDQLSMDSKKKTISGLFFCLVGSVDDGHSYAQEAVENGAVAIVTQKRLDVNVPQVLVDDTRQALGIMSAIFNGNPSHFMRVIGITGTNGKTTTAHMLCAILKSYGEEVGIIGTLGIRYCEKCIPTNLTTPDPIQLQEILQDMRLRGVGYVVMEVSAHALHYKKTAGIQFAACIFSNLTQDHLDFFDTVSAYKAAKVALFQKQICPIAVVNGDDVVGREIGAMREKQRKKTIYFGISTPTDAFAVITSEGIDGTDGVFNINDNLCAFRISMTGRHNVYNALSAAVCAIELGVSTEAVERGLRNLEQVRGRLERIGKYCGATIYLDFAHTPDGLQKTLDTLGKYCNGRLICLFGCGGNRDKSKRSIMGEIVAKKSDFAVITSDNPRYEDPLDIITQIEHGYRRFSIRYVIVPDRRKAIEYALDMLSKGDILLLAGKGGEDTQEIMGIKYPFDEQAIVEEILDRKGNTAFHE